MRTLHSDHRKVITLFHDDVEVIGVLADPGEVLITCTGIDYQAVPVIIHVVHDEVIDDTAAFIQHTAVKCLAALRQFGNIVRQQVL